MHKLSVHCALSLFVIAACSREPNASNEVDIATAADVARDTVENYADLPPATRAPRPIAPAPAPTMSTPPPAASDEDGPGAKAAAALVRHYYDLIAKEDYASAWRLWDNDGAASEMTEQDFAASFAKYASHGATVGSPGRIDAGAGQRYVTVPVRISGRLKDGDRPFVMAGPVTLHRTADIDGATQAQRHWRISASGVRPRPLETTAQGLDSPARTTARYRCDDGTDFTVVFDNRARVATLDFGKGESVRLPSERPASGIWYRNPRYELRGKGRSAMLTRGRAMPVDCVAAQ